MTEGLKLSVDEEMQLTELEEVLSIQGKRYPLMTPQDGIKLIYQNEFGSEHMIADKNQCLERLKAEWRQAVPREGLPLYEYIGNGVVRVNINSPEIKNYPLEKLSEDFIRLSETHKGDEEMFVEKIRVLLKCCRKGCFGFSEQDFWDYLKIYLPGGLHPVSHSEEYRKSYSPAYRLVSGA